MNAKLIDLLRKYRGPILEEWERRLALDFSYKDSFGGESLLDDLRNWIWNLESLLEGRSVTALSVLVHTRPALVQNATGGAVEWCVNFFARGEAAIQPYLVWRAPEILDWSSSERVAAVRRMHEAFKILAHCGLEAIFERSLVDAESATQVSRRTAVSLEAVPDSGRLLGPADFSPN